MVLPGVPRQMRSTRSPEPRGSTCWQACWGCPVASIFLVLSFCVWEYSLNYFAALSNLTMSWFTVLFSLTDRHYHARPPCPRRYAVSRGVDATPIFMVNGFQVGVVLVIVVMVDARQTLTSVANMQMSTMPVVVAVVLALSKRPAKALATTALSTAAQPRFPFACSN